MKIELTKEIGKGSIPTVIPGDIYKYIGEGRCNGSLYIVCRTSDLQDRLVGLKDGNMWAHTSIFGSKPFGFINVTDKVKVTNI